MSSLEKNKKIVYELIELDDFEPVSDVNYSPIGSYKSNEIFLADKNHTPNGCQCLMIDPGNGNVEHSEGSEKGNFYVTKKFDSILGGKKISLSIYDDLDPQRVVMVQIQEKEDSVVNLISVGIKDGKYKAFYQNPKGDYSSCLLEEIPRKEGWRQFTIDCINMEKVVFSIDDIFFGETEVREPDMAVMQTLAFVKNENGKDGKAPASLPVYIDDVMVCTPSPIPSKLIVDKENGYIDWAVAETKRNYDDYELSLDGGSTYEECSAKPMYIEAELGEISGIHLRCKASELVDYVFPSIFNDCTNSQTVFFMEEKYECNLWDEETADMDTIVEFCSHGNPMDYTAESWGKLECAVSAAKASPCKGDKEVIKALIEARNQLVFNMDSEVKYTFNQEEVPTAPIYGSYVWDERQNISFLNEKSLKIYPEMISGNQVAQFKYTFPLALKEKQIIFYYNDDNTGEVSITIGDSQKGEAFEISADANSEKYFFTNISKGVKGKPVDRSMKRNLQDIRKIEINMTNGNRTMIYMDSVLVESNPNLTQLDYIDIVVTKKEEEKLIYLTLDELTIRDKNPVTAISYPEYEVNIGYHDTYEMNVCNYTLEKPYDYETTDKFSYSIEDSQVAHMTKGGSVQPIVLTGTTYGMITNGAGVSQKVKINVVDYKPVQVEISDAIPSLEPHMITELTLEPEDKLVLSAIISPENVTNRGCTWTSSDEAVITVDQGMVEARGIGTAEIKVVTVEGNIASTLSVTVAENEWKYGVELYVSVTNGDDNNAGTLDAPFATVERARDEIRLHFAAVEGGAVIYIREGTYYLKEAIYFDERDGGDENHPLKITNYKGEKVVFTGAFQVPLNEFQLVSDEVVLNKLPEVSRGKVYEKDLSSYINKTLEIYGGMFAEGKTTNLGAGWIDDNRPYYNVSLGGQLMTLSRWPNATEMTEGCSYPGYSKMNTITYQGANVRDWMEDMKGKNNYVFPEERDVFDGFECKCMTLIERMKTWKDVKQDGADLLDEKIWYSGFTGVDYTIQNSPIRSIAEDGTIKSHIASTYHVTNAPFTRLYVFNLIQELDIPGEWYLDHKTKKLYIYPYEDADMNSGETSVSIACLDQDMFQLHGANYVTVEGLHITNTLGGAINIVGGSHNTLKKCLITNTSSRVGNIKDSEEHLARFNGIYLCTLKDVNGGIMIEASRDFENLTPGNNYVRGCLFENYSTLTSGNNPAVNIYAVGNEVSCNEMKIAPNNAIMWRGSDNVIQFNNVHHIDLNTTDSCAIYTGRNALTRGSIIRNNYIHHLGKLCSTKSKNIGIYIDDMSGGVRIYDNVIEDIYWGIFINGGQDNYIVNNTFKKCHYGVIATDWSYCWLSRWYQHAYGLKKEALGLEDVKVTWREKGSVYGKYPHFQTILQDAPNDSIYNKMIDNEYPDTVSLFEYRYRSVIPNEVELIKDWYFTKNNCQ